MDAATYHDIRRIGLRRNPAATRAALIRAARQEFEDCGFEATQSNRIARRAGYAPQTFYRHFTDKIDILLAVYADWVADEHKAVAGICDAREAARALLNNHRSSLNFRRALCALSITEERVRAARAKARLRSVAYLRKTLPYLADVSEAQLMRSLLLLERLMDACAEGELAGVTLSVEDAEQRLSDCLEREFGPPLQAA